MAKVVVLEEEETENIPENKTWYNTITASRIDKWRVWPRLLITLYGIMFYRTTEWFMSLPEPTNAQSAFISVIVGAGAAWFGLYCGSGGSKNKK
tara:strand:- start:868 stop:1149 length:282 start_codon:yes stop_codon:yes gene_type:complete